MTGSAMKPHLTTSARPATKSARGSVSRASRSHSTPAGGWKAPTRFLPSAVLMPVLPPTAASTIASSVVGTCTTSHPAQPGRGDEPGEVGGRPPPTLDHGVGAGEAGLPEDAPEERGDLSGLGLLGVGHLGGVRLEALGQQRLAHAPRRSPRARGGWTTSDPLRPRRRPGRAARRADRCRRRRRRVAARRVIAWSPSRSMAPVAAPAARRSRPTTSAGLRPSVSTRRVATSLVQRVGARSSAGPATRGG